MRTQTLETDIVVVGGGLAGVAAAVAAARKGRTVALVNNRPVLGGNSSSEVRVWVCGATAHGNHRWARETGIIGEMLLENQYRNPEGNPVHWDDVVLDTVRREPNVRLFLNTDVRSIEATGPADARRITSVTGWTMGAETTTVFRAPVFLDCTGDGLIGHLAGARYRLGKEGRDEFGEDWAPVEPRREFLGSTLLFYTKDVGHPVRFVAPESARDIATTPIPATRIIRSGDNGSAYWWIEWGGELDIVEDDERIRDELRSVVLGIWDHIKNSGQFDAEDLDLEWVGNLPGKREYRRFVGDHTLTQNDVVGQTQFPDTVAFGGWSIDLHPVEGMYATGSGAVQRFGDGVFEIPYRCLYSVNVENMLMAGRNISATHVAFGATRVMATCAALGEAAGTAAALAVEHGTTPRGVYEHHLAELRDALLRQDATLIGVANTDPDDLARTATVTATSSRVDLSVDPQGPGTAPFPLDRALGIVLPVDPRLDGVDLWLAVEEDTELTVEVWSTGLAQNVIPARLERSVTVPVAASADPRWHRAPVSYAPVEPGNAVVVLRPAAGVSVLTAPVLPPGVLALVHGPDSDDANVAIDADQALIQWPTKPLRGRSVVFAAYPATRAMAPERVAGGYQRPYGGPNAWVSGPLADGPQSIRLDWDEPVTAAEAVVVLDADEDVELNTLHRHRTPEAVMPSLVKDYVLEILPVDGDWTRAATVTGNRHRRRAHPLPDTPIRALRLVVGATNGVPEARVVALRVQR